jgi:hypothetical protein
VPEQHRLHRKKRRRKSRQSSACPRSPGMLLVSNVNDAIVHEADCSRVVFPHTQAEFTTSNASAVKFLTKKDCEKKC